MFYNFRNSSDVRQFELIESNFKKKLCARFIININHINVYLINDLKTLDMLLQYGLNPKKYKFTEYKDSIKRMVNNHFDTNRFINSIKTTEKLDWLNKHECPLEKIIKSRVSLLSNEDVKQYYIKNIVTPEKLSTDKDLRWNILISDDLNSLLLYKKIFELGINKQDFYKEAFSHSAYNICKYMLLKEGCIWDEELYIQREGYLKSQKEEYIKAEKENKNTATIYKSSALLYDLKNEIIENEKNVLDTIMNKEQYVKIAKNQKRL